MIILVHTNAWYGYVADQAPSPASQTSGWGADGLDSDGLAYDYLVVSLENGRCQNPSEGAGTLPGPPRTATKRHILGDASASQELCRDGATAYAQAAIVDAA